jgi:hypothetical protein
MREIMRKQTCLQLLQLLILFAAVFITSITASQNLAAEHCSVNLNRPPRRIVAYIDDKLGWREDQRVEDIPEVALGSGVYSYLWADPNGLLLIRIVEPTEDFAVYSDYCFDRSGRLVHLKFELRTAWGWAYREESAVSRGLSAPETSEFFSTATEQHTVRPEMAVDISESLKPRLYLRESQLPVCKLLTK